MPLVIPHGLVQIICLLDAPEERMQATYDAGAVRVRQVLERDEADGLEHWRRGMVASARRIVAEAVEVRPPHEESLGDQIAYITYLGLE